MFCSRAEGSQASPPLWEPGWELQTAAVYLPGFINKHRNFQISTLNFTLENNVEPISRHSGGKQRAVFSV